MKIRGEAADRIESAKLPISSCGSDTVDMI
jgi:hypothetical protein